MNKPLSALLIAIAGWFAAAPAEALPTLSIVPSSSSTTVGGSVSVDLMISGLNASNEIVSGFDLDVYFDAAILNATNLATVFAPWGTAADVLSSRSFVAPGHVEFILTALKDDDTLAALQSDSFLLSRITLAGLKDGFSNIAFGASPDFERNVVGRNASSLALNVQGACVAVGAGTCIAANVPEPATAPLVLLGLAAVGLAVNRRRTRRPDGR